jgi:hypothetical protein
MSPIRQAAAPLACALVLLVLALPVEATLTASAITGRVMAGEQPLAGVTVMASSPALQHARATLTGPRGTYWLGGLPPGLYDVTFSRAGMTTLTRRAVVELGRVARSDAELEPSADEESITSTARQISVADTTAVTSHFDDATLDRLPGRDTAAAIGPDAYSPSYADVDGAPPFLASAGGSEDLIEQVTSFRAAPPVEYESYGGKLFALRTRSGREDFFLSLRDTVSNDGWNEGGPFGSRDEGLQNLFEAHGGGRIVSQRLWFFAGLWDGGDATRYTRDQRGVLLKLHGQAGAAHHVDAQYATGESGAYTSTESSSLSLRHTGVFGPRIVTETLLSRATSAMTFFGPGGAPAPQVPPPPREHADFLASRGSWVIPTHHGDHVLTAGVNAWDMQQFDTSALFVSDRWSASRWVVNAGVRYEDTPFRSGRLSPRVAVTYDLRGDGTQAIAASYGEYSSGTSARPLRIAALGYAIALGTSGTARADLIRRGASFATAATSLQLDGRYRLFDRFELGGTYTYTRFDDDDLFPVEPNHQASAWAGVQLPARSHEFGVTVLQRLVQFQGYNPGSGTFSEIVTPTDVALRYAIPLSRLGLTFAADVTNAFGMDDNAVPRTVRFWTRVRL